jgi:hypothetical protein
VPGFKFGRYHHFEETVDPDRIEREPRRDDEELLRGFAARYFPGGSGPTMSLAVCMFTNTSDNHFVIDLHPDYPQGSFASPCSGHGFKFASVIGEIMADLAERGTTRHNIELFRLDRLLGGAREPAAGRGAGRPWPTSLGTAADQRSYDHRTQARPPRAPHRPASTWLRSLSRTVASDSSTHRRVGCVDPFMQLVGTHEALRQGGRVGVPGLLKPRRPGSDRRMGWGIPAHALGVDGAD